MVPGGLTDDRSLQGRPSRAKIPRKTGESAGNRSPGPARAAACFISPLPLNPATICMKWGEENILKWDAVFSERCIKCPSKLQICYPSAKQSDFLPVFQYFCVVTYGITVWRYLSGIISGMREQSFGGKNEEIAVLYSVRRPGCGNRCLGAPRSSV